MKSPNSTNSPSTPPKGPSVPSTPPKGPSVPPKVANVAKVSKVKGVLGNIKSLGGVMKYRKIIFLSIILMVSIYIAFIISKSYKISKTIDGMKPLDGYVVVSSKLNKYKNLKLCDFYVASAFRPYLGKHQFFNYIDLSITEKIITNGVRSIYVDIFNDHMGIDASPVISTGLNKGQWKLSLNTVPFEDLCKLLSAICFNAGYVNNFEDPFILMLNLNVNGNITCLNKIRNSIYTHLRRYLLSNKYTYGKVNMGQVPMKYLKNKLLIFTSNGYQHSDLEEFVNYSWEKESLKKISYDALDPDVINPDVIKIDGETLKNYNKNNITIVTPKEAASFTHLFTRNYEPHYFWDTGCQIVCMNYQKIDDDYFDHYIKKFKHDSFIPKPDMLRGASIKEKVQLKETELSKKLKSNNMDNDDQSCPEAPSEDYLAKTDIITYKDENSKHGLCYLSDEACDNDKWEDKPLPTITSVDKNLDKQTEYKLCCSKERINDPKNLYYMSQIKSEPEEREDKKDNYLNIDLKDGNENFKYLKDSKHLYLHKIEEQSDLENNNICAIDVHNNPSRCPKGWNGSGTIGNNYSICCKNT